MLHYQGNDQMMLKHWLEIVGVEFLVQALYHEYTKEKDGTRKQGRES